MKKYLIVFLALAVGLNACKKDFDDAVFEETPDQRLAKTLNALQTQLSGAANGWIGLLKPADGPTYSFYFDFKADNRVVMFADIDSNTATKQKESSYRLKALQQPSLIFDTYSYIHLLADPDPDVAGGTPGAGFDADFEFAYDPSTAQDDTIRLKGRFKGSDLILVRATQAQGAGYYAGQFSIFSQYLDKILTYFKRLTIGSQQYDVRLNATDRTITLTWVDGSGAPREFTTSYYNTLNGAIFAQALVNGGQTISGLSNAQWNASTNTLTLTSSGGTAGTIRPVVVPLYVDRQAPRNWWQFGVDNQNYWISVTGFHVNGVDDAFNIRSITSGTSTYFYLIYWPEYDPGNDLFAPVYLNAAGTQLQLLYGAAPSTPNFTTDGRAVFSLLGNYGTYPPTGPARLTRDQLLIPQGYYFVKISDTEYDMVSAADGLAWLRWEF